MCIRDRINSLNFFLDRLEFNRILGDATYELVDCDNNNKVRGKFNIWQIKKYYAQAEKVQVTQGCGSNIDGQMAVGEHKY